MDFGNGTRQRRAGTEAIHGAMHSAVPKGFVSVESTSTNAAEPDETEVALAKEVEDVRLAGRLIARATTGSDVRFELIAELREKIAMKTYNVDAADVAERLIGTLLK